MHFFLNIIGTQSCLTGKTSLSWVLPLRATKPGKLLETIGMGITYCAAGHTNRCHSYFSTTERRILQQMAMAPQYNRGLSVVDVFILPLFIFRTVFILRALLES